MLAELLKRSLFRPSEETIHVRAAMHSLLRLIPAARNLLDVGCGDGKATELYASTWNIPPNNTVGIEFQDKYKQAIDRFIVKSVDIEREPFPFADQSFDLVVCNQVLEHLKIVLAPLREMARVTRENGFLAIGIPNLSSLMSRLYLMLGKDPICLSFPGPHIRGLTHRSFTRFLSSNPNFALRATTGSVFYPVPLLLSSSLARRCPGLACYTFYLLQKIRHRPDNDWPAELYLDESVTG